MVSIMSIQFLLQILLVRLVASQITPSQSTVIVYQTVYTACNCGSPSSPPFVPPTPIPGSVSFPGSSTATTPSVASLPTTPSSISFPSLPSFTSIPSYSSPSSSQTSSPEFTTPTPLSTATASVPYWNDTSISSASSSLVGPATILPTIVNISSSITLTPFSILTSSNSTVLPVFTPPLSFTWPSPISVPSSSSSSSSTLGTVLTASAAVAVYSTITIGDVAVTGVTVEAPSSPTSCFTLPVPTTSLEMLAVSVNQEGDTDLSQPVFLYFANNATTPSYVGSITNGSAFTLDLSPNQTVAGQLGLSLPGEQSVVFDTNGINLFTGDCGSVSTVNIDNFWQQLQAAGITNPSTLFDAVQFVKRQATAALANFNVEVSVDAFLRSTLNSPTLTFGNTPCAMQNSTVGPLLDNMTWTCEYPPPGSGKQHCQDQLSTWVYGNPSGNFTTVVPHNGSDVLSTMSPFLARAGTGMLKFFPGADPSLVHGFNFLQGIDRVAKQAVTAVGNTACQVLHAFDQNELIVADNGTLGTHTLGAYVSMPPTSMEINLAYTATASAHNPPPRKVNPADRLLKQLASIFPLVGSILGALPTPSLPLLGGVLGMPTEGLSVSATTTALTGTITSTVSPAQVNSFVEAMPTVTVTHVLGEGWFTPSSWVIGASTSMVHDANYAMATEALAALQSSASMDIISEVVAKLASIGAASGGAQPGSHWDWQDAQTGAGDAMANDRVVADGGSVVLVTTTVTVLA